MKKILTVFICVLFLIPLNAYADFESDARALYDLRLLKGTGDSFSMEALNLDRDATRAEVCITLLRMLGKEEKANYQANPHPFGDVPGWASNCIGWLYENWLVNGVSDTYFGAQDTATVQQFSAMTLRALGYSEQDGDFDYSNAVEKAVSVGLFDGTVASVYELSRRDMILIISRAMRANICNSSRTLIEKLCDDGAVDRAAAEQSGFLKTKALSDAFADIPENLGGITLSGRQGAVKIHFNKRAEHYGLRVFYAEKGGTVTEIPSSGTLYFEKGDISYAEGTAAGYVEDLYVYGLDTSREYSFIVIKSTSEGNNYVVTGKSAAADWRQK